MQAKTQGGKGKNANQPLYTLKQILESGLTPEDEHPNKKKSKEVTLPETKGLPSPTPAPTAKPKGAFRSILGAQGLPIPGGVIKEVK